MLSASRSGEDRNGPGRLVQGSTEDSKALALSTSARVAEDFSVSLYVGDRQLTGTKLAVRLRGRADGAKVRVVLVDRDGAAWASVIPATTEWQTVEVPLAAMKPSRWAFLPQGFPGTWNYWSDAPSGPHPLRPSDIERLQFSLRREDGAVYQGVEIEMAALKP